MWPHFGKENGMFDVTIKSDYLGGYFVDGGNQVFGKTAQFPHWSGHHTIQVSGMGDILILDLVDKKLDKYTNDKIPWTKMTWGGVVRYRGLDAYFRYEGVGSIEIRIDLVGSVSLRFKDRGGMVVNLADLDVG
jgi:hypothetical protein